ncbi:MAG TPA: hypothetical protein VFC86_07700 [Planctomycetota bacterium]|nr:hypothetical protein [Planctomycetota bacterium]
MNRRAPGSRKSWIIIAIAAVAVAGLGVLYFPPWIRAGEAIDSQRQIVASRVDSLRSQRVMRPVLFEPAESGNGWRPFVAAVSGVSALTDKDLVGFPSFSRDDNLEPDPVRIEAAIELIRFKIESLKHAFRRPWVEPEYEYENMIGATFPEIARALTSSKILCDAAANAHARGRGEEAVDLLVINLGIADRLTVKSHLVQELSAVAIRTRGLETLKRILSNHHCDAKQLERLARALEACDPVSADDAGWMVRQDLAVRLMMLSLYDRPEVGWNYREAMEASADHYYSPRIMFAECFAAQDRYAAGMEALAARPLWERGTATGELLDAGETPPNLHRVLQDHFGAMWHRLASVAMEHRLARVAVAVASYNAEKKEYPSTLESLPRTLSEGFAGRAFDYTRTSEEARIDYRSRHPEPAEGLEGEDSAWRVRRR